MDRNLDALSRQWHVLRMIPRYPKKITIQSILKGLNDNGIAVGGRTVYRDLAALSQAFPLMVDERAKPYGWSWQADAVALEVPSLSLSEALAFKLVEQFLEGLMPHATLVQLAPYFRMAERRLAAPAKDSPVHAWPDKVRVVSANQTLKPPWIDPQVQEAVSDALLFEQQMQLLYQRRADPTLNEYRVHPLALVQRGPVTYLVATLFDYPGPRLLVLHRMHAVTVLKERSMRPADFNIDRYIASGALGFGDGELIHLEVIFHKDAADHLHKAPLSDDQEIVHIDETRVRVTATLAKTPQLEWWLMAFGDKVEVVKPQALRQQMQQIAE
ncbi:MAG: WYL domain-containing protein [Thiobacillaceae bacterium]